jgi:hypothetical protein
MLSAIQQIESQVVSSALLLPFKDWFPIISFLVISAFKILWNIRLLTEVGNWYSAITADGTYFSIYEPTHFSSEWFSSKFKGPGVKYELAILIRGGRVLFIYMVHALVNGTT